MNSTSTWAVEYSHTQESFHIGRTAEMLRRNIATLHSGEDSDYICVGIFPTREQALGAVLDYRRRRTPGQTMAMQI